ncbi:MAG TPA: glycosyltransferase [Blastocatellia bacterium]|nr:glycosyltransferase [Blastocatellia bacterium]
MAHVAILTPSLTSGDAVSNDVLGMQAALQARGHHAAVFSDWVVPAEGAKHIGEIGELLSDPSALLIYHHAVGWDAGYKLLSEALCKRVVKYHNVTPPEFFEGINDLYKQTCEKGIRQLTRVVSLGCDVYLSDSEFNMKEIVAQGADAARCHVVAPFNQIDRLSTLDEDAGIVDLYQDGLVNILTVGRIVPNKGHRLLIDAFGLYHEHFRPDSRLIIVGGMDERLDAYTVSLMDRVSTLGLSDAVLFTGQVSDNALKAYYLAAHVFAITSMHEGFCVPLVEAMAMKLPIVALGSTAIPGTVGGAGIVWSEPDPWLVAGSFDAVTRDKQVAVSLGLMGWHRYRDAFTRDKIESRFLDSVATQL